jgi:hypothetical protein
MMTRTLSLQIYPQSSPLALLTSVLSRHGFRVDRQKVGTSGDDGISELTLSLQGEGPLGTVAKAELLAIEGVLRLAEVAGRNVDDSSLQRLLHRTYPDLEKAFPAVSILVRNFAPDLDPEQRQCALHALGRQLGRRRYRAHYAEGSPLPLAQALQRIVIPALRPVAQLEIQGDTLVCPDCSVCSSRPGLSSSCIFFAGMIQGLLEDAPATRGAAVSVLSCERGACACRVQL